MAYRGGGWSRGANHGSKRPNPSPTPGSRPGSGFENQFAELASFTQSPAIKRQRTQTGGGVKTAPAAVPRPSSAMSKKSPLKFDFKTTRKEKVVNGQEPKVIPRPLLPSQKTNHPPTPPPSSDGDLWDDDDDDWLLAASQALNTGEEDTTTEAEEAIDWEELAAMTAMMADDDFDFDDNEAEQKEPEPVKPTQPDVFKAPAPLQPALAQQSGKLSQSCH